MEYKIDVVMPNLHTRNYDSQLGECLGLLYSLERQDDVTLSARVVNDVVKKHIDVNGLRVRESDFNIVSKRESQEKSKNYSFPLDKHLDLFDNRGCLGGVTNSASKLFGLHYIADAGSYENEEELLRWRNLKRDLADPDKTFDESEKSNPIVRYDRAKTLENMKGVFEELNPKIANQVANLDIFEVQYRNENNWFGFFRLSAFREQGKEKINVAKSELVEKFKEFKGPCLSLDAFNLYMQRRWLYDDAENLVNNYGDILLNPNWQERFFRLDP